MKNKTRSKWFIEFPLCLTRQQAIDWFKKGKGFEVYQEDNSDFPSCGGFESIEEFKDNFPADEYGDDLSDLDLHLVDLNDNSLVCFEIGDIVTFAEDLPTDEDFQTEKELKFNENFNEKYYIGQNFYVREIAENGDLVLSAEKDSEMLGRFDINYFIRIP